MSNLRKKRNKKRVIKRILRLSVFLLPVILLSVILSVIFRAPEEIKDDGNVVLQDDVKEEPKVVTASILSTGDIIMHQPFIISNQYKNTDGSYDYNSIFKYVKPYYTNADYTVVNFESTVANGNYKGYPRFHAPAAITNALAENNVDLCLLANNHIYDNGDAGMNITIDAMETNHLTYMGIRKNSSEKKYLIQEINGIKVGFFNYVYAGGTESEKTINAIPVSANSSPLINTFNYNNLQAMYTDVKNSLSEMKQAGVKYTIAYIHWGNEYQTKENGTQRQIASALCELGVDALIGGHPHVVQPVDLLTSSSGNHQMICVYSVGNHLSNQYRTRITSLPTGHTEDGLMVNLVLQKNDDDTVSLTQVDFIPTWVYRTPGAEDTDNPTFYILPLDNPDKIVKDASSLNIESAIKESISRTNAIIGDGKSKIVNALPITNK